MMRFPVLLLALPLAACLSFGPKPARVLVTLTSDASVPAGTEQRSGASPAISIAVPATPQSLAVPRVPVQTGQALTYVKDVAWIELPSRQFARMLADTLAANGRIVLSSQQSFGQPSAQLSGELRNFGIDGTTREAVVTFDASLVRGEGTTIEKKRFEARVPVAAIDSVSVGPALNQAANKVAGDVAAWIGK